MQQDETAAPTDPVLETLRANLAGVRRTIDAAATRASRAPERVRLVAVTKTVGAGIMERLLRLGVTDLGENRIQDALAKMEPLQGGVTWHLVGSIQANKSRRAVDRFHWVHSLDSAALFDRMDRQAEELGTRPRVLLQVNVSGEETKHGFAADAARRFLRGLRPRALMPVGLMTMAPLGGDPEQARPHFRKLRELLDDVRREGAVDDSFRELSMGMTDDYPVAVEEGATLVRIGRALFSGVGPEVG